MRNSEKFIGSAALETSVAAQEIIPTIQYGVIYDFEMLNDQACHISVNGGSYIYLRAEQGIQLDMVTSLKIQENNITFNWVGEC